MASSPDAGQRSGPKSRAWRQLYRKQFRKTKLCRFFPEGECKYVAAGEDCPYAHDQSEIEHPPDLTKTALCQKFQQGLCKLSSEECHFAHGQEELRATDTFSQSPWCKRGGEKSQDGSSPGHGQSEFANDFSPQAQMAGGPGMQHSFAPPGRTGGYQAFEQAPPVPANANRPGHMRQQQQHQPQQHQQHQQLPVGKLGQQWQQGGPPRPQQQSQQDHMLMQQQFQQEQQIRQQQLQIQELQEQLRQQNCRPPPPPQQQQQLPQQPQQKRWQQQDHQAPPNGVPHSWPQQPSPMPQTHSLGMQLGGQLPLRGDFGGMPSDEPMSPEPLPSLHPLLAGTAPGSNGFPGGMSQGPQFGQSAPQMQRGRQPERFSAPEPRLDLFANPGDFSAQRDLDPTLPQGDFMSYGRLKDLKMNQSSPTSTATPGDSPAVGMYGGRVPQDRLGLCALAERKGTNLTRLQVPPERGSLQDLGDPCFIQAGSVSPDGRRSPARCLWPRTPSSCGSPAGNRSPDERSPERYPRTPSSKGCSPGTSPSPRKARTGISQADLNRRLLDVHSIAEASDRAAGESIWGAPTTEKGVSGLVPVDGVGGGSSYFSC